MTTAECERFESILTAAADGDERAAEHLRRCRDCRSLSDDLRGLVALLEDRPEQAFPGVESPSRLVSMASRRAGGAIRAAALALVLLVSGWGLLTFTPVHRRGAGLRGVPGVVLVPEDVRWTGDRLVVGSGSAPGAVSYQLVAVSLTTGRSAAATSASVPLELGGEELAAVVRDGEVVWYLRAWNGAHMVAESPPSPLPPVGLGDAR